MPGLSDLLADPDAELFLLASISYYSSSSVESTEWVSQHGWSDPVDGPVGSFIPPLLDISLQISQHIDPLDPSESFGSYSQLTLLNDLLDSPYTGRYDSWHRNSIDGRPVLLYLVGILSSGARVELADVLSDPLFSLIGVDFPEVGDGVCTLFVRDDSHNLDSPLQPVTYSPPCLSFPGTTEAVVSFGDHYDQSGSFSCAGWVYLEDPTIPGQYTIFKDGTSTGFALEVGSVLQITVRAQSPQLSTSAAGLLHSRQWHYVSFNVDTATGSRVIGLDGATVLTTVGVTGAPSVNSVSLTLGRGLRGKLSGWRLWSIAQGVATMWALARLPVDEAASGLDAYFPLDEGVGSTTRERVTGLLSSSFDPSITWATSGWHLPSLVGSYRPWVVGTVPRAPVSWIDPAAQVGEVSYGGCALISEVQSNHNALGAIWTPNLITGTFKVITGTLSGTYSAAVTANNLWNSALQVSSTSTILATINSPNNSCTLSIQYTPSKAHNPAIGSTAVIMGWQGGAGGGQIILRFQAGAGAANTLEAFCTNNAVTFFTLSTTYALTEGRTYSLALTRDTSASLLSLHVDGELIASTAISGTFTATVTSFGVGVRPDSTSGTQAEGRYDEPLVFSSALSQSAIRALHLLPATSLEPTFLYGWRMDDATGSSAASMLGGTALTLANTSWVPGRSSAADLARQCYYLSGYVEADLDAETWRQCLNDEPADCGWSVGSGESALEISRLILGGLSFIPYKLSDVIYIGRFAGLSGIPDAEYTSAREIQGGDITPEAHDPAVREWQILYAHNNVKLEAANIAGSLASSDPDRYQYGQMDDRTSSASDYGVKRLASGLPGRFPGAISKVRKTALLNTRDADNLAALLLSLHRDGGDIKSIPLWLLAGSKPILHEASFDVSECELDLSDWIVIGMESEDDDTRATIWRPAAQEYPTNRITDEGDARITDDGKAREIDE